MQRYYDLVTRAPWTAGLLVARRRPVGSATLYWLEPRREAQESNSHFWDGHD